MRFFGLITILKFSLLSIVLKINSIKLDFYSINLLVEKICVFIENANKNIFKNLILLVMRNKLLPIIHLLVWCIIFFIVPYHSKNLSNINPYDISFFAITFFTFYLNYFILLPKATKKSNLQSISVYLLLFFSIYLVSKLLLENILISSILGYKLNDNLPKTVSYFIVSNSIQATMPLLFSSFIWFVSYTFKVDEERKQLLKEKNEAELSLLKSQINPHFIFNTLNNIYSLVNQNSNRSLYAIEKLGDLLRYSGKELNKDFTEVEAEVGYIQNFIDLESLRLQKPENVHFKKDISTPSLKIAPMLLIPFIENAFKHGDLKNGILKIEIKNEGNNLIFNQKNKILSSKKDTSSGIGIENVKKRLELIYPKKHTLKIGNNSQFYEVDLRIELIQ